jgi:TrmH RNA methyltransferase
MDTQTLFGRRACLAVFERRPEEIRRIYYRRDQAAPLKGMLAWAASRRIAYRELDEEELRRVAKSAHHEGLVLATEPLRFAPLEPDAVGEARGWMALDRVENPHNLGAILRTCAFLGVEALLAGGVGPGEKVNAAALRVAEGGAEHVRLFAAPDPGAALQGFAERGYAVVGLETDSPPLRAAEFATAPWVLVAGHEQEGLAPAARRACTAIRSIAGTGAVSSLNVSVAVGIALAALTAQPEEDRAGRLARKGTPAPGRRSRPPVSRPPRRKRPRPKERPR